MKVYTSSQFFNADRFTPIGLYLGLRHKHRNTCLLESNDYHDRSQSASIIGLDPILEIQLDQQKFKVTYPDDPSQNQLFPIDKTDIVNQTSTLLGAFQFNESKQFNGFYGRVGFEFSHYSEKQIISKNKQLGLPDLHLFLFRYLIIIDHFKDEGIIIKNDFLHNELTEEECEQLLSKKAHTDFPFERTGAEKSEFTELEFENLVNEAITHCKRGNVFQLVLSNAFSQSFFGDEFNVYRELRRLNPSPYLFYFDFESYRLMGSSPEAQLIIKNGKAEIHPIAGTVKKSGDIEKDKERLSQLKVDEKENAEHVMLVDLARNDLSRFCSNVKVETFKEIQQFSHVFHIVSKVTGNSEGAAMELFNATFPAGTLSGAPKPKALELIDHYEMSPREYYGGAIGFIEPNGNMNMAIVIRSILSKENALHFRAGAGIVIDSISKNERQEVDNKLNAVRNAIQLAHNNSIITVS
jgi:anthranilate synthase component 1